MEESSADGLAKSVTVIMNKRGNIIIILKLVILTIIMYLIDNVQFIIRRLYRMGFTKEINPEVLHHIQLMAGKDNRQDDSYLKELIKAWQKKERTFMNQVRSFHMTIESEIQAQEKRAFIALTYSGSILGVGPSQSNGSRQVIYASVGQRRDVPEKLLEDNLVLKGPVKLDKEISFTGGTLQKSSPVYKIALMNDILPQKQTQQLEDATRIMTREFVSINNTIVPE
jgi:hypothetical protein